MDERYDLMRSVSDGRWLYIHNFRPDLPYVQPLNYMFQARGYQSWARVARDGKLTPATAMFWGGKPTEELYDLAATLPPGPSRLAVSMQSEVAAVVRRWTGGEVRRSSVSRRMLQVNRQARFYQSCALSKWRDDLRVVQV